MARDSLHARVLSSLGLIAARHTARQLVHAELQLVGGRA